MKRDIVFITLLAAASALFLIGDAQAGPFGPRTPGPCVAAQQTDPATPYACPALAAGVVRPEGCPFRGNRPADWPAPNDRPRARLHQHWTPWPAWN